MMLVGRGKMITGFKVVSVLLLAYMLMDFYYVFKNENSLTTLKIENTSALEITKNKLTKFDFIENLIFCEKGNEIASDFDLNKNSLLYYSLAIFLGAFVNVKKIMKIGVM